MIESRRDKFIFFGAVPIFAAIMGGVATVTVQRLLGADLGTNLAQIISSSNMAPGEKIQALILARDIDKQFYDFLRSVMTWLMLPIGVLIWPISDRIREGGKRG